MKLIIVTSFYKEDSYLWSFPFISGLKSTEKEFHDSIIVNVVTSINLQSNINKQNKTKVIY